MNYSGIGKKIDLREYYNTLQATEVATVFTHKLVNKKTQNSRNIQTIENKAISKDVTNDIINDVTNDIINDVINDIINDIINDDTSNSANDKYSIQPHRQSCCIIS